MMKHKTDQNPFDGFRKMAPGEQESIIYSLIKTHISRARTLIAIGVVFLGGLLLFMWMMRGL